MEISRSQNVAEELLHLQDEYDNEIPGRIIRPHESKRFKVERSFWIRLDSLLGEAVENIKQTESPSLFEEIAVFRKKYSLTAQLLTKPEEIAEANEMIIKAVTALGMINQRK